MRATLFTIGFRDSRLPGRFWDQVETQHNGCWLWSGYISETGYGMYSGKKVHRIIAALIFGERAIDGLEVLHDCPGGDNKLCLRGEHLFIGTAKENAVDSIAKGQRTRHAQKRGPISRLDGRLEEIIDTCRANSMSQACKLLGVSDTQLRRWLKDRGICPSCLQGISHDQRANGSGVGRFIPTPCGRSLMERGRPLFISQHGG